MSIYPQAGRRRPAKSAKTRKVGKDLSRPTQIYIETTIH